MFLMFTESLPCHIRMSPSNRWRTPGRSLKQECQVTTGDKVGFLSASHLFNSCLFLSHNSLFSVHLSYYEHGP